MMKTTLLFCLVLCATATFGQFSKEKIITACEVCSPRGVFTADLDGDSDLDVITVSEFDNKIAWYKNDGTGRFLEQILITTDVIVPLAVVTADLDGDGDLDIIPVSGNERKLVWYKNNGAGNFSGQFVIGNEISGVNSIYASDLDNDGDLDVLALYSSLERVDAKTIWYRNDGNGVFSEPIVISTQAYYVGSVHAADFDGDGDNDVLTTASSDASKLAVYENDGNEVFTEKVIAGSGYNLYINVADLDNDGDLDIVAHQSFESIAWLKNDGTGNFSTPTVIGINSNANNNLSVADLDADGDKDVIFYFTSSFNSGIYWSKNDGTGNFSNELISTNQVTFLNVADLNGDNHVDILSTTFRKDEVVWYKNNTDGTFISEFITKPKANGAYALCTTDLDGNGYLDVLAVSRLDGRVTWYKNDDTHEFSEQIIIAEQLKDPKSINAADFDNDNDVDVIVAGDNMLVWYQNDGSGIFSAAIQIPTQNFNSGISSPPTPITIFDLDSDGDLDIIYAVHPYAIMGNKNDGSGNFSEQIIIYDSRGQDYNSYSSAYVADIDRDTDLDIITTSTISNTVTWLQNNGNGIFSSPNFVANALGAFAIHAADFDQDGDLDVLVPASNAAPYPIKWAENDGSGQFPEYYIVSDKVFGPRSINVADVDGDGHTDVVSISQNDNKIAWYRNYGNGEFSKQIVISYETKSGRDIYVADLDNDDDMDLLAVSENFDKIAWYENLAKQHTIEGTVFWDENINGVQDSTEQALTSIPVTLSPDALSSYTDFDGKFRFYATNGQYTLTVQPNSCWQLTTDSLSYTVNINNNIALNRNFGFQLTSDAQHTQARINSSPTRCGFDVPFWISVQNDSCGATKGVYGLILDSLVTFIESQIPPSQINGDTLLWDYERLVSSETDQIRLTLQIAGTDYIGDTIRLTGLSYIENAQGELQLSSTYDFTSEIRCAYDPNDKLVYPNRSNIYNQNYTLFDEALEYTIRFQNTGNDTAFTVIIRDTLDSNLDWSTFKPITASHNFETLLHPNGLVEFTFKNILLPDSTTNEPLSHGFVTFRIVPMKGLEENTAVNNTADIYFDFNPPIRTNIINNVFVSTFPKITGTQEWNKPTNLTVFPNPFSNTVHFQLKDTSSSGEYSVHLINSQGQRLITKQMRDGNCTIEQINLVSGLYFYTLTDTQGYVIASGKVICM